jgi:hypothetical protein
MEPYFDVNKLETIYHDEEYCAPVTRINNKDEH